MMHKASLPKKQDSKGKHYRSPPFHRRMCLQQGEGNWKPFFFGVIRDRGKQSPGIPAKLIIKEGTEIEIGQ